VKRDLLEMYRSYCAGTSDIVIDERWDINLVRAA
jgi:hypothetical protein